MADHKKALVRRATEAFCAWTEDESTPARFERTVAQGVIAAVIVGVTTGQWGSTCATAVAMAVLAPVQAALASKKEE